MRVKMVEVGLQQLVLVSTVTVAVPVTFVLSSEPENSQESCGRKRSVSDRSRVHKPNHNEFRRSRTHLGGRAQAPPRTRGAERRGDLKGQTR